jgi:hypothetical protein
VTRRQRGQGEVAHRGIKGVHGEGPADRFDRLHGDGAGLFEMAQHVAGELFCDDRGRPRVKKWTRCFGHSRCHPGRPFRLSRWSRCVR